MTFKKMNKSNIETKNYLHQTTTYDTKTLLWFLWYFMVVFNLNEIYEERIQ